MEKLGKPTMKFRWKVERTTTIQKGVEFQRPFTRVSDPVLQQFWVWSSDDGDESEEEWRDVPVEEVDI